MSQFKIKQQLLLLLHVLYVSWALLCFAHSIEKYKNRKYKIKDWTLETYIGVK
jgi:hypothetical protein